MTARSLLALALLLPAAARSSAAPAARANPVAAMLDEQYGGTNEQAEYWGASDEAIFEAMASSEAARAPRSREFLWKELRSGRMLAAGVLWRLDRDPKVVDFLVAALGRGDMRPPFGRDEIPFVLGYARDPRALPALWAEVAAAPADPYRRTVCAKAIYRISKDPKAADVLRAIAASAQRSLPNHESYPQDVAKTALKDLGLEPAPKSAGEENR